LLAWAALHLPFSSGYFLIAATLVLALLVDRKQFRHLIHDETYLAEFLTMRTALTVVATACLVLAGIAIRQF
jgi:integral membrane sensor domain MASE1